MQLTLPLPPSDNALRRSGVTKKGKPYSFPTNEYKDWLALADKWLAGQSSGALEGDVTVHLAVYFPSLAGDLTNRVKAAHDRLQGVAYSDDSQIVAAAQRREVDAASPRIVATVQPVTVDLFASTDRRSGTDRRRPFEYELEF